MKATVLHIIESLVVGGAEVLLTESLKGFSDEHRHVVVYMRPPETLLPEVKADKVYCLNYKGKYNLLGCAFRLRKIIKKEKVKLVHAHHYWPTIAARLAKPADIQLISTIHSLLSHDAFIPNRLSLYLEKLTYKPSQHTIFVSDAVGKDYKSYISVGPNCSILYNFVKDEFFLPEYSKSEIKGLVDFRLVAVGSLRAAKNYTYLLRAMEILKEENISLDIIGDGPLRQELQARITDKGLQHVTLKGSQMDIYKVLNQYDAFILSSAHEGFGIAMVEAIAVGLPCILSDIEAHREVTAGNALFFNLNSPEDCAAKIIALKNNPNLNKQLMDAGKERVGKFRKQVYLNRLEALYKHYLQP